MAVSYNKFEAWVSSLGLTANLNTDTFMVYVTNNVPSAAGDTVKGDLLGATEENGYAAADITNTYSEAGGTGTMGATDVVITATGSVGPFQYVVIYDDNVADSLMCWWDYGSAVTLADGETFTIDFVGDEVMTLA
jgi:hypothetical protein